MRAFFAGIVAIVLSAVTTGLAFVPNIGLYMLISSIILEIAALAFLSAQKKKEDFKGVFFATIIAYALLAASAGIFIGGMVFSFLVK